MPDPGDQAVAFFNDLVGAGIAPSGLGARDTLRLEAGMALYGNDMDESISPLDAGLAWTVDFSDAARDFVGKAALLALEHLAQTKDGIIPAHKHMFRDFGVRLRQNSQPDLALLFSRKAVELAPEDDHAHFNLARILCSLGMYDEAAAHIATALSVSSEEPLYFKLLEHIRELKQARSAAKAAGKR